MSTATNGGKEMFQETVKKQVVAVYFVAVSVLMHFFLLETLDIGIWITYRHLFALLLVFSAFISFLLHPNLARGAVAFKSACVMAVPLLVMTTVSLLVWAINRTDFDMISRGLSYYLIYTNQFTSFFLFFEMEYMFGEKGICVSLTSIRISNLIKLSMVIWENGAALFFTQLWELIMSFASTTGDVIAQAEIHELAFCLGVYILYMLLYWNKRPIQIVLFLLSAFCFIAALKRIAIVGIAVALVLGYLLRFLGRFVGKREVIITVNLIFSATILLLFLYIVSVKLDLFTWLEQFGIETSGRSSIYLFIDGYYRFAVDFLGQGMGFVTYLLNEVYSIGVSSIHNDFLQFYIDLGFCGYLLWLLSMTFLRSRYFSRNGQWKNRIVVLVVMMYVIIISSTDNTLNYPLCYTACATIIIGHGFDEQVRIEEQRYFGSISKENQAIAAK